MASVPSIPLATERTRDYRPLLLVVASIIVLLDRFTKLWIDSHLRMGEAITVIPRVFRITHVLNTGAAFSMFAESASETSVRRALIGFSICATLIVGVMIWRVGRSFSLTSFGLALILGGAIGNLYDRLHLAYVIDFLEVHIGSYHWPDFNVADSAICVGACLLMIEIFTPQKSKKAS